MPSRLQSGTMINLNDIHPAQNMKLLLQKGRYFRDERDIDLISSTFERARLSDSNAIINIGDLNKKQYSVSAETVLQQGGESFKKRIKAERIALGISEDDSAVFALQQRNRSAIASVNDLQMGSHSINGTIHESEAAAPGVIVRLELILRFVHVK